jgi:hypothetical protein
VRSHLLVGGCLNAVYLAGFMSNPLLYSDGRTTFEVMQSNDPRQNILVELPPRKPLRAGFGEAMPVKVVGHLHGYRSEESGRSAYVRVMTVDRPAMLDMPGTLAWEVVANRRGDGPQQQMIRANLSRTPMKKASNHCQLAGFLSAKMGVHNKETGHTPYLMLLIRQHESADAAIPVRLQGQNCFQYGRALRIGMPIFIDGTLMRDGKSVYVNTRHIKAATEYDIPYPPKWADDMIRQIMDKAHPRKSERSDTASEPDAPPVTSVPAPGAPDRAVPDSAGPVDEVARRRREMLARLDDKI